MDRRRLRFWISVSAALLVGLCLRLWFINDMGTVAGDGFVYGDIAKNLLLHHIYGISGLDPLPDPTLIRVPGYPFFLALCFRLFGVENYNAAMFVQAGVDLLSCCLAAATAARIFGQRALLPVLWIAVLCPFTANYAADILTETLVLFFIALTFYALVRWQQAGLGVNPWLWLVVAALSGGILLRPEQGILPACVIPAMLWMSLGTPERRQRLMASAAPVLLAAICVLLPLVPWTIRNWRIFHVIQPLAPSSAADPGEVVGRGIAHWYRSWGIDYASTVQIAWPYDGSRVDVGALPTRAYSLGCLTGSDRVSPELYQATTALFNDYNRTAKSSAALDARFEAIARQRIQAMPFCYYVGLPVARLVNMLLRPRTEMMDVPLEWWKWRQHPADSAITLSLAALNLAYLVVGLAGFLAWRRLVSDESAWLGIKPIAFAMAASILLRCVVLLSLDISEPRYTLEFFPVLFVCAGALFTRSS